MHTDAADGQGTSANQDTVSWFVTDLALDGAGAPDHDADPADIETYRRDGVVVLRGAMTDWVDTLRAGLQRNLDDPAAYAFPCESTDADEAGRFFDSYCNWQLIPEYLDYVQHSPAAAIAGRFMGSSTAQLFHEHAFMKSPGTQHATPWHQDMPYYCVTGTQTVSVYVSLDHADADVAVRFVKGSHRWGKLFLPRDFLRGDAFDMNDPDMAPVPDIDADPGAYDVAAWALEPGDTILFDFRTLHGTTAAEIKSTRRAFSSRWLGDDATYCERRGETSPPYTGHGMRDGQRMREDWFPVLWRRPD